jgi:hypothetical protein
MILRELYYFDKNTFEKTEDDSYSSDYDQSTVKFSDTRKTRLTLGQINRIRKANDFHNKEKENEIEFIKQMYGNTANMVANAGI